MQRQKISSISCFISYRIVSRLYFHLPILFLYLYQLDMGILNISILIMLYGLSANLSSFVTIRLNRILLYKHIVICGELGKTLGLFILLLGSRQAAVNITLLIFAQIIGGMSFSLALTNDTALLKVILAKQKQSNRFVSLQAKSQSGMFISTLLAGFIGGILYDQQPDWPFILSILSSISSIVFIYLIDERDKISLEPPNSGGQKSNKAISHYTLNSNQIFWTYFYAISRTFTITPFLLIYPLYFMYVNVEPILFGIVLSLFTLSAYVVTVYSKKIIDIYGKLKTLVVMFSLMQIAFFSLWVANISQPLIALDYFLIGLFSITCLGLGSGAIRPITMANIDLSNTPLLEQVKIFTKMEKLFGILNSFLIVFCGILITVFDLQNTIFVLAILYLVSMYCLKVFANPDIKSS